ncbi:MAG TPA: hypothetical protein VG271_13395 [Beijerinckiaceae bacterium]|jgi:hypothetical protein|nr:hypothetical protein [Beijerinckiaceae bacterium]
MQVETVKIVSPKSDENPHGYIVINKDDLREEHELFVEAAEEADAADPAADDDKPKRAARKKADAADPAAS